VQNSEASLKIRLDKLLLERGLTSSRERAQALILAGKVLVGGQKIRQWTQKRIFVSSEKT